MISDISVATTYVPFTPNSPSLDYPSYFSDSIKAGVYRYTRNGREYVVTLPEMGGLAGAPDTWSADTGALTLPVKTLVLDGVTSGKKFTNCDANNRFWIAVSDKFQKDHTVATEMCSHFAYDANTWHDAQDNIGFCSTDTNSLLFRFSSASTLTTVALANAWIAAQSAAGTPVTVIYQLATPVTSTITPTMVWDIPVYDRSDADYQTWLALSKIPWSKMTDEQKSVWSVPMKGAYNYTDLNRVGMNLLYLQELFADYGYSATVNIRMDYVPGEWPAFEEMENYVQSISNIRSALAVFSTTPSAPSSMDDGTVVIWNNIEQILTDVERLIENMSMSFRHCGTAACGQGGLIL